MTQGGETLAGVTRGAETQRGITAAAARQGSGRWLTLRALTELLALSEPVSRALGELVTLRMARCVGDLAHPEVAAPLRRKLARLGDPDRLEAELCEALAERLLNPAEAESAPTGDLSGDLGPAALAAWASAHRVGHWLVAPAEAVLPGLPGWIGRGDSVAALLATTSSGEAWRHARMAALARLAERAEAAARGDAAHAGRAVGRGEVDPPVLAEMVTALQEARAELAESGRGWLSPRPADELRKARLRVSAAPPGLVWRLPATVPSACCRGPEVSFLRSADSAWTLRCRCQEEGPPSRTCEARVEAVERMLDLLLRPGRAAQRKARRTLASAVGAAPWQAGVDTFFDAAELPSPKRAAASERAASTGGGGARFVWCVVLRTGRVRELRPAQVSPRQTGGLALERLSLQAADRALPPHSEDRPLLALARAARALRGEAEGQPLWRHLLDALRGADHVVVEAAKATARPVRVERRRVGLALTRRGQRCVVQATLDGGPVVPDGASGRTSDGDAGAEREATAALVAVLQRDAGVYWDAERACVDLLEASPAVERALSAAVEAGCSFPLAALGELRTRLSQALSDEPDALVVARSAQGATEATDPSPWLRLALREGAHGRLALHAALVVRPLPGHVGRTPGRGPAIAWTLRGEAPVHGERDLEEERRRAAALWRTLELPVAPDGYENSRYDTNPWAWLEVDPDAALDLVARSQRLAQHPSDKRLLAGVFWDGRPLRVVGSVAPQGLKVELDDKRDWFALRGSWRATRGANSGGQGPGEPDPSEPREHSIGALLAALRDGRRYAQVGEGDWVEIDAALRKALFTPALQRGQVSPLGAPQLASLAELGAQVAGPARWLKLHDRVREAASLEPALPPTLNATLRPYQEAGFQWLARLCHWAPGAVLADDMGLGKTVQALALLLRRAEAGPQLVVAPTSVLSNWQREAGRFAPSLRVTLIRGKADLACLPHEAEAPPTAHDLVLTTWDALSRHGPRLAAQPFATVVFDEAQAAKNARTRRARAAMSLDAGFRLALTGTPLENHTGELWSLMRFTVPGLLSGERDFRARFRVPIERYGDTRVREALGTLIRPFVLRRLKSEVARELPPRQEIRMEVDLDPASQRQYERLRASLKAELGVKRRRFSNRPRTDGGERRLQVLAALTRLRQMACHPALLDPTSRTPAAKVVALRGLLAELRLAGHQALVFSQFTSLLDLVRPTLEADGLRTLQLDGRTPGGRRQALVDGFQRGDADVLLISLKAGGTGLNLTAASYVIHLDPWWNPAAEDQATDRAHRIGQDKPVTVVRMVARGTVEEAIFELHRHKRDLVTSLLSGASQGGDEGRRLRVQDLETLVLYSGKRTWERGAPA